MRTIVTDSPRVAASYIRAGRIAAFPTETVYGLGADAFDAEAVAKIFDAKGRPSDNPLIVHLHDLAQLDVLAATRSGDADRLIEHFFPGPLTVILPKSDHVPDVVTAGLDTVGLRMPKDPRASAFLKACGMPVAAPSANLSGRPSPTTWEAVLGDLDGRIPCILKGDRSPVGLESTVVNCNVSPPVVLRAGAVSLEQLRDVVSDVRTATGSEMQTGRSPGIRHRHYAPSARVQIVAHPPKEPAGRAAYIGLANTVPQDDFLLVRVCSNLDAYAYELFDFFRECDAKGVDRIYCQQVDEDGIGRALMDRLRRAEEAE